MYIYIHIYMYMYMYMYIHCGSSLRSSQTGSFRKPDVCPGTGARFRKPVLAGLRSNNEMNSFGFRTGKHKALGCGRRHATLARTHVGAPRVRDEKSAATLSIDLESLYHN